MIAAADEMIIALQILARYVERASQPTQIRFFLKYSYFCSTFGQLIGRSQASYSTADNTYSHGYDLCLPFAPHTVLWPSWAPDLGNRFISMGL